MSATTEQKVDFLLKKVGFTLSKTGSVTGTGSISGGTTKEPFAESIPSPLVVPDTQYLESEFKYSYNSARIRPLRLYMCTRTSSAHKDDSR